MPTPKTRILAAAGILCLALLGIIQNTWSQQINYDPYLTMPVTFYDFHSDRSNPEFEQPNIGSRRLNAVDSLLDADGKPKVADAGTVPYLNHGIRFWFRDWRKYTDPADTTYKMRLETDARTGRPYLERFRPIYTYGNSLPPGTRMTFANEYSVNHDYYGVRYGDHSPAMVPYVYAGDSGGFAGNFPYTTGFSATPSPNGNHFVKLNNTRDYSIDTAYKNIVTDSFLIFTHTGNGIYTFDNSAFFPLNGKGFEALPGFNAGRDRWPNTNQNFSYTMEMVWDFKMQDNLQFQFRGDDDVWVFINGKLALDLGGVHGALSSEFNLNSMRSSHQLVNGQSYKMHLFYCERHTSGSSIRITTNIITTMLSEMDIELSANEIMAGDSAYAKAVVKVDTGAGILRNYDYGRFAWTAADVTPGGPFNTGDQLRVSRPTGSALPLSKSDSIFVYAEKAYTTIRLAGEYFDSLTNTFVRDTAFVRVLPGPPARAFIEQSRDSLTSLRDSLPLDTVRIGSRERTNENFYAIIRDRFGNWVGRAATSPGTSLASALTWSVADASVAAAGPGTNGASAGQGRATKGAATEASATPVYADVILRSPSSVTGTTALPRATSIISVADIEYRSIQIGVKRGGASGTFIPASAFDHVINMTIPSDTALWVRLERADGGGWIEAQADWDARFEPAVSIPGVPGVNISRIFEARTPTVGSVTVSVPGNPDLTDYVDITTAYSDPVAMRFYNRRGQPDMSEPTVTAFPPDNRNGLVQYATPANAAAQTPRVTVTAGVRMPVVAALFGTDPPAGNSFLPDKQGAIFAGSRKAVTWEFIQGPNALAQTDRVTLYTDESISGDSVIFRSTLATYNSDHFRLRATYSENGTTLTRDILIRVIPAPPRHVFIEPANSHILSPNVPMQIDTLTLASGDVNRSVYAMLRDEFGNRVAPSGDPASIAIAGQSLPNEPTIWSIDNELAAMVANGFIPIGEGVVTKAGDGLTTILRVKDQYWNLTGTAAVKTLGFYYDSLTIAVKCHDDTTRYCVISELEITTNDMPVLYAFGRRNTTDDGCADIGVDGCWDLTAVDWDRSPELGFSLRTPPSNTSLWTLDPRASGKGEIYVTRSGKAGETVAGAISVTVKTGPPMRVELILLTPADNIAAGSPVEAEVRYYNRAGFITPEMWDAGWIVGAAAFIDTVGCGGCYVDGSPMPKPTVTSGGGGMIDILGYRGPLPYLPDGNAAVTGRENGVVFHIYFASDAAHQIRFVQTVNNVQLTAVSERFRVRAGVLARVQIERGGEKVDSLVLSFTQNPQTVLFSAGYDRYGNKIGDVPARWCSDGDIPAISGGPAVSAQACVNVQRSVILYDIGRADRNGEGTICIDTALTDGTPVTACVPVRIHSVTTPVSYAITRDTRGCGYLNLIEVMFPRSMKLEGGADRIVMDDSNESLLTIINRDGTALPCSLITISAANDSVAQLWLRETQTTDFQTGWRPVITIDSGLIVDVGYQTITARDGAAPVIASARRFFDASGNVRNDQIRVTFSEPVRSPDGRTFRDNNNFTPAELFRLWEVDNYAAQPLSRKRRLSKRQAAAGTLHDDFARYRDVSDNFLRGIANIYVIDDMTLRFDLENEADIGPPRLYINIKSDRVPAISANVRDVPANFPDTMNRRVPITFGNEPGVKTAAIPNPAFPDGKLVAPGRIEAFHKEGALDYVTGRHPGYPGAAGGGVVFQVPVYIPRTGEARCHVKIYDLAGNLVIAGEDGRLIESSGFRHLRGEYVEMDLYWNGFNSKGMRAAPGAYRIVVMIAYGKTPDPSAKNRKFQGTLGISK